VTELVLPVLQQWLLFSGAALAVGCVTWRLLVAPRAATQLDEPGRRDVARIERSVASLALLTALVLVAAWALRGAVQLANFRDPFVPIMEDVSFLLGEMWGKVWMAQGAVVVLLALAFAGARAATRRSLEPSHLASSPAWTASGALVLALTVTLAMSSHAMGVDRARVLLVGADGLHSLAAGAWIGSLAVIVAVGRSGPPAFAAQLRSFSPLALASGGVLVTMGLALAWTHLGTPTNLWTTSYGRVLAVKLAAVGLVFLLGFLNWRRGLPVVDTAEGAVAVRRRAAWEVTFAGSVLLLTALLVHTAKP